LASILTNGGADPVVCQCVGLLGEPDPRKRLYALSVLAGLGAVARTALPFVLDALRDEIAPVRYLALQVLREVAPEARVLVPCLIKAVQDPDDAVRRRAVNMLGDLGPEARLASAALVQALRDRCPTVRRSAAAALGEIGPTTTTAVSALIEALREDDVRFHAIILAALVKIGARAVPRLLEALHDPDPTVRRYSARAVRKCPAGHDRADCLTVLLNAPHPLVREDAEEVLR
jgi:HEAT repeat protein